MKPKLISTLAVISALAISACGGDDQGSTGSDGAGNEIDRAFVEAMIPHHESAIEMAKIAQERGTSEFVLELADDIVDTQSAEIETLRTEDAALADAGIEVGDLGVPAHMMGMSEDAASLKTAEPFDESFLNMMIPHHEGAVEMARVEMDKGSDPELIELAEDIVAAQEAEIEEMQAHLSGKAPAESEPDGGAPSESEEEHGGGHG